MVVLSVKPAGSAGETEYEATAPPDDVGVFDAIAVPVTYDAGFVKYVKFDGAVSAAVTVIDSDTVVEPAALVAVTV